MGWPAPAWSSRCRMAGDGDLSGIPEQSPKELIRKWVAAGVPAKGSLELTDRCNLRCVHCYIRDNISADLSTAQWLSILDQIADAGCLQLLLTGGEPLLRQDFMQLYVHAKRLGMLVAVFTNGTLLTPEHIAMFRDLPPRYVEISVYGASEETCARVTGVKGAFARCLQGVDALQAGGIEVAMKTVVLSLNESECEAIRALATARGLRFRADASLFPRFDGDHGPLQWRVDPRRAVACEMPTARHVNSLAEFHEKHVKPAKREKLYICGAGRSVFHVSAQGMLQACTLSDDVRYDLKAGSFLDGWQRVIPAIREIRVPQDYPCATCHLHALCGECPPVWRREGRGVYGPCKFGCQLGEERLASISAVLEGGKETCDESREAEAAVR